MLASAEIYDPVSRKFKAIANMAQACAGHIAELLKVPVAANWIRPDSDSCFKHNFNVNR